MDDANETLPFPPARLSRLDLYANAILDLVAAGYTDDQVGKALFELRRVSRTTKDGRRLAKSGAQVRQWRFARKSKQARQAFPKFKPITSVELAGWKARYLPNRLATAFDAHAGRIFQLREELTWPDVAQQLFDDGALTPLVDPDHLRSWASRRTKKLDTLQKKSAKAIDIARHSRPQAQPQTPLIPGAPSPVTLTPTAAAPALAPVVAAPAAAPAVARKPLTQAEILEKNAKWKARTTATAVAISEMVNDNRSSTP